MIGKKKGDPPLDHSLSRSLLDPSRMLEEELLGFKQYSATVLSEIALVNKCVLRNLCLVLRYVRI